MARKEARIFTSIWQDADFRALHWQAQWVFFAVLSQPLLSYCGITAYTPKRWATLAQGLTARMVRLAVEEAQQGRFVVVDDDTEEMLVRSFVKRDGILKSPNLATAMGRDFAHIHSGAIRDAFLEGLPEGFGKGFAKEITDGLPEPIRERSRGRGAEPPSPYSPPPSVNPKPSSTTVSDASPPADPVDDDDRRRLKTETLDLLGKRHLAARMTADVIARKGPVGDVVAWQAADRGKTLERHGERLKALTAGSAAELAELLEPTPRSATVAPPPFEPSEAPELPALEAVRPNLERSRAALLGRSK